MGRQRGFLPPSQCQLCGKMPELGQTLCPGDQWRCLNCQKEVLPGNDCVSKAIYKMMEYREEMRDALDMEAQGAKADEPRNRAEWARRVAAALKRDGDARSQKVTQVHGEAVRPDTTGFLYDTLMAPDLASVEASFARTNLLLEQGPGVAAMALDAIDSIQARNSLEKMLMHQLVSLHQATMEHLAGMSPREDTRDQAKRLHAAAKCQSVYQQGLLTLKKLRQTGTQRIVVQYVNVSEGGQAVIGNVERAQGERTA